jgi:hypothetical protein
MSANVWGAHVYSVLVSAFCGDEFLVNLAAREIVSPEKSSRLAKAFEVARSPRRPLPEIITALCCLTK